MVSAGRHPKKEIAEALKDAVTAGLEVIEIHRGHRWGVVVCAGCVRRFPVFSTPRSPFAHASQVRRFVRTHSHAKPEGQQ